MRISFAAAWLALAVAGCTTPPPVDDAWYEQVPAARVRDQQRVPVYGYRIVRSFPHDITAYTEGLQLLDGYFYEGTGRYGLSTVRKTATATGKVAKEVTVPGREFGEGLTVLGGKVFQLTYLSNTGFIYDAATLELRDRFRYLSQGWGLTNDGERLIQGDGSSSIRFVEPTSFTVERTIFVHDDQGPVGFLNELEFAGGKLYANVWQTDFIAIIDPADGAITGWIDLAGINPDPARLKYPFVRNGIAFDPATGHLIVTGKCWPELYEIELVAHSGV